eukprot:3170583-Pleurochrysis_carterae.AAC.1
MKKLTETGGTENVPRTWEAPRIGVDNGDSAKATRRCTRSGRQRKLSREKVRAVLRSAQRSDK